LYRISATGVRSNVAKVNLNVAMTREGAPSDCAKRIKIEAVETASIAMSRPRGRRKRARPSLIMLASIKPEVCNVKEV
jgi:hypothetical protein